MIEIEPLFVVRSGVTSVATTIWDFLVFAITITYYLVSVIVRLHEVEITLRGGAEIGNEALVDAVGAGDDAALRGLPEHLGQAHHRHSPR
jgi:hypothetical protein